ncbi:helix-turn-helix transcriptional regulator [Algibacter luteus]|uniref:DNA binding domain-containing protein, excisionase family n=1 Tax=Algibacter luteus TaxID=1178825 RepID=A0A1M6DMJ0_9FLAO|nr:helix-turn-helix domain-containing protein [Algibacter luteus]SHI74351.1 DNA binding domain-containing protein, excisionase family [Algibacter luteus]
MEKTILNLIQASNFTGYSKSHLYKLTHYKKIRHYKPNGKNIFFLKEDLENFLLQGKKEAVPTEDIEALAANYLLTKNSSK